MAVINQAAAAGLLKPVFGTLQWTIAEENLLQRLFKFEAGNSTGSKFVQPVEVRAPWGVSFMGTSGDGASSGALATALASATQSCEVTPSLMVLRTQLNYALIDRSQGDKQKAFINAVGYNAKSMNNQMRRLIEITAMCGQSGIGTIASTSGTTSQVWTISAATLRPGLVGILEGAYVDLYQADLSTPVTNAQALLVTAVNTDAGTITVTSASNPTSNVAGYVIFLAGANASGTFYEQIGLRTQISQQTGDRFGIATATYSAFRGNVDTGGGPVTAGYLTGLVAKAANKGLMGRAVAVLSPKGWAALNSRVIAAQVFDQSYKPSKAMAGVNGFELNCNGVVVEVYQSLFQADGECMILPKDDVIRVGSSYGVQSRKDFDGQMVNKDADVSFDVPGSAVQYMQPVIGYAAVEMQCRTDQQILLEKPNRAVLGTGITY